MTKYIQAQEAFVVTGIGTSETQITLSNFKTISGVNITQSMIGGVSDYVAMTLSPRTDREEQVLAKVNSTSGDNVVLDIIRAVNPVSPYNAGGGVAKDHNVNDTAVISNNPALFNKLTAKDNNETVSGDWTFDGDNTHNGTETFTGTVDTAGGVLKIAEAAANDEPYTKGQADALLTAKANANATVNLTGNQTVAGVKTFSSAPIVPSATNSNEAINKGQVEAYIAANSGSIKASDTAFGTTKLDVPADTPTDPKALTATAERSGALSGDSAPSLINKYLTKGKVFLAGATINGATTPVPVYQNKSDNEVYPCDGNDTNAMKFIGFAISNGTNGNNINVQFSGIVSGFTGLSEGEKYYVQDIAGTIGTSIGTYEILVGVAVSETELLIQKGKRQAAGNGGSFGTSSGSLPVICGFRPAVIKVNAATVSAGATGIMELMWTNGIVTSLTTYNDGSSRNASNNARLYSNGTASNYIDVTITSITDTGFTITWTETGIYAPSGDAFRWEAEGEL